MKPRFGLIVSLLFLVVGISGCGGGGSGPSESSATQSATGAPVSASSSAASISSSSLTYPAFSPSYPQVETATGAPGSGVLKNPIIIPVFYQDTPNQQENFSFLSDLVTSSFWMSLSQYDVGAATVMQGNLINQSAPSSMTRSQVEALVQSNANQWANGNLSSNDVFVIELPPGVNLGIANASAYHSAARVTAANGDLVDVQYAVIPMDSNPNDQVFVAHEIVEAVTDVDVRYGYRYFHNAAIWALQANNTDSELADLCGTDSPISPPDMGGYYIRPVWSNTLAAKGLNPCFPDASTQSFGAVPQLPNTINGPFGLIDGVVVAPGATIQIPVRVFASDETVGALRLTAHTTGYLDSTTETTAGWVFSLSSTTGSNGDTVMLSITAPAKIIPGGVAFSVTAVNGAGKAFSWPGLLANQSSY